jgi:signal transduction histidine kinase
LRSYDLKTPLTPMFALLPLLEKRVNDEKGKEYVSLIERNSRFMKDLVNKTITYAKLNSDNIEFCFSEINIHEFVNNISKDLHQLLTESQTEFVNNISKDLIVLADTTQLKELFNNLISNAVKYKQDQKPLQITLNAQPDENQVIISIEDNGIGMTKEQISYVFDEFYKADDSRSDIDSHGLGLNICKRIIEKHNGSIWVESEGIGKGSKFSFTLNLVKNLVENGIKEC